ncbi:endo alpha-1,4 polygalactosaminidase [Flavobacterium psychrotolerans]|uniref:endo alpha-1,4 polygalactosaminidase n=1 Tax=Flavobacterium psychrotolerans TaxID=2169410 RepID=UPI00140A5B2D|nr:endo alpha-1,4 polygalactosaminidase [Flavobacterium psychrotolerans]
MPSLLVTTFFANSINRSGVLVCYGKLKPENIKGYSYVILESKYYLPSDIRVLKSNNDTVFAYLSLGEVNANASHYEELKNAILGKNEIWNSYYLDLKSEKTKQIIMQIIENTLELGYDGLFFDNIDNFSTHGPQKDQKLELIALLKTIKEKYPKKKFIQNSGLDLVSETSSYINAIVVESVASNYTFNNKSYKLRNNKDFETYMLRLKSISESFQIPVILIEYANSEILFNEIVKRIAPSNFEYFIGNIDLQNIPKFK